MNDITKKKILLVEDDVITATVEAKLLEKHNFEIIIASTGRKAINFIKSDPLISLVLMDIDLGRGIDGKEASIEILKIRVLPIVFLTSHSEREMVNKVRKITRYGYVLKNSGEFVLISSINMAFELFETHMKAKVDEERWKFALEGARDGIWDRDIKADKVYYSKQWKKIFGYNEQDIGTAHDEWKKRIHPEDKEECIKILNEHLEGKTPFYQSEHRLLCKNGKYKWTLGRGKVTARDKTGKPLRIIGTQSDISYRKETERALQKSEELYRSFVNNFQGIAFRSDINLNPLFFHGDVEKITGYKVNELIAGNPRWTDIIHPDDLAVLEDIKKDIIKIPGFSSNIEYRITHKKGEIKWVQNFIQNTPDDSGKPEFIEGAIYDITERKYNDDYLEDMYLRLEHILNSITDFIWSAEMGQKGKFEYRYYSPVIEQITGRPMDYFIPNPSEKILKIIHPDDLQKTTAAIGELFSGKKDSNIGEYRIIRADGEIRWIRDSIKITKAKDGIKYLNGILTDITDQKIAGEKIKKLLNEKELLLKEVHHRIKNNMNTIGSILSLQAISIDNPEAAAVLEEAKIRVLTMMTIYDKLYRSEDFKNINIKAYLDDLIDEIYLTQNADGKIKIENKIEDININTKQSYHLGIIITEIITNSFKYAFPDTIDKKIMKIKVMIRRKNKDSFEIKISDNGIGMPDKVLKKKSFGFGLGLVQLLVEQDGGSFEIITNNGTLVNILFKVEV